MEDGRLKLGEATQKRTSAQTLDEWQVDKRVANDLDRSAGNRIQVPVRRTDQSQLHRFARKPDQKILEEHGIVVERVL